MRYYVLVLLSTEMHFTLFYTLWIHFRIVSELCCTIENSCIIYFLHICERHTSICIPVYLNHIWLSYWRTCSGRAHRHQLFNSVGSGTYRRPARTQDSAAAGCQPSSLLRRVSEQVWFVVGSHQQVQAICSVPFPQCPALSWSGWQEERIGGGGWTARYWSRNSPETKELFFVDMEEMCMCVACFCFFFFSWTH